MNIDDMELSVRAYHVAKHLGCKTSDDIVAKIADGIIKIGANVTQPMFIEGVQITNGLTITTKTYTELVNAIALTVTIDDRVKDCEWCKAHGYHTCDNPGYC